MSQMNYGLNARGNVLCTIYEKNTGKKRRKKIDGRCMREREFFCHNSRKVETKRRHLREKKKRTGTSFHQLLLLVSEAHSIGAWS